MRERAHAATGLHTESASRDLEWASSPFTDSEEAELAARFLEVEGDRQLDRYLGGLIQRATLAFGGVGNSRLGRVLGGMLKSLARDALPGREPGPAGVFAPEREFESARRFVRFAGASARQAARSPSSAAPIQRARAAIRSAARRHPPILLHRRPTGVIHDDIDPSVEECRCACPFHRGRRVVVINL